MPDAPRFSVTIPAYNAAATVAETVRSVQAQTLTDWELVIVDDGSTDDTLRLAEELAAADARIRVISQENRGSGGAYNTAVREARSDLLVMLSADDLLMPEHLESLATLIAEHPDAAIFTVGGWYEYEDGTREIQTLHASWADPGGASMSELLSACFFGIGAVYRREVFDAVGGFREDIYAEDYLFWMLVMAHGYRHRYLDRPLAVHRRNEAQKSADAIRMREADSRAVREVVSTGLLSESEAESAMRVIRNLGRNIAIRRALGGLLGSSLSARLLDRAGALRRGSVRR